MWMLVLVACGSEPGNDNVDAARVDAVVRDASGAIDARASDARSADGAAPALDVFGVSMLYPSAIGGGSWDSQHWSNGNTRVITGVRDPDPDDPTGWSQLRGSGTPGLAIDGAGVMTMTGNQPRLYIDGLVDGRFWKNVEVTMYYRRRKDDATATGGGVIGVRSGPDGHTASSPESCTATTYYARLRHDAHHDFAKELQHPTSEARDRTQVWPGESALPVETWIGIKLVARNSGAAVQLEHYRDLSEGAGGGTWELLGTVLTDSGGWAPAQGAECNRAADHVITEGGGVVLIRNTLGTSGAADYRWVSIREIEPL